MATIPKDPQLAHRMYELMVTEIYKAELRQGDAFIDLGANIGHHTWQMAEAVGSDGAGFAIEPVSEFGERVRNVLHQKSIEWVDVVNSAAADYSGTTKFFVQPDHIGWSSMFPDHVHPADADVEAQEIEVAVGRIDDLVTIPEGKKLGAIKVDVENAEFPALRGTAELMAQHRPVVIFENNPKEAARRGSYEVGEFLDFFHKLDYQVWSLPLALMETAEQWADCKSTYYVALPEPRTEAQIEFRYGLEAVHDRLVNLPS